MKGFVENIERLTLENEDYRRVLYTAKNAQLVLMCLRAGEEIGEEVHELAQFLRIEAGTGKAVLDGVEHEIGDGTAVLVPAGTRHNIINTGEGEMKLYTLYAPPEHRDGVVQRTKEDSMGEKEHFDGTTTE